MTHFKELRYHKKNNVIRYWIFTILIIFGFSLTTISCSSEDDAALKDGKLASDISEVDQLDAPSGTVLINNGDASTSSTQVSLILSASDSGLVSGYYVSETNSAPSSTATEWVSITNTQNYSATVDFTLSSTSTLGEHPRTVYAWFKDTAENVSSSSSDSITLLVTDTTSPNNPSIVINNDNSNTSNTAVTLALSTSDDYGVSAYYVSEISTAPSSSNSGWTSVTSSTSFSSTISFTITGASSAGSYSRTVYAWFKDDAGNVSSSASDEITLIINDTTNPSNPSIIINNGDSSTSSTVVTLALSATDNVGITAYYASENNSTPASNASGWNSVTSSASYSDNVSFSLASEGSAGTFSRTVYTWFKDAAGNVSGYSSDAINLVVTDTTAPASPNISINSGADNTTSTNNTTPSNVTLTLSATDAEGVIGYYASESSTDPANNASGWTSVTSSTSYSDNVSFTLTAADSAGNFTRTVHIWFKDAAGNVSDSASDGVLLLVPWTQQFGSSASDIAHGITVDYSNNIYVIGWTQGRLPGYGGASGGQDIFLTKYNSSGTKQWLKQIVGSGTDVGRDVAVDSSNNVFITGRSSTNFDGNNPSGRHSILLMKFDPSGDRQWSRQLVPPTGALSMPSGIHIDSSGNIYLTGHTQGSLDNNTHFGGFDIFLLKYNSSGTKQWTQQFGTTDTDKAEDVTVDSSGNIYVTGSTNGELDGNTHFGGFDIFLLKYNSSGTKQWTKQFGTVAFDTGWEIVADNSSNIYITGHTAGSMDGNTSAGGDDIFLAKYYDNGTKQWTKQLGSSNSDWANGVATDSSGNVYVSGSTMGELDGNINAGSRDLIVVKYNSSGAKQWTKQLGTSTSEEGLDLAVDNSSNIYITGHTLGGLFGNTNMGGSDTIILKFNSDGDLQ